MYLDLIIQYSISPGDSVMEGDLYSFDQHSTLPDSMYHLRSERNSWMSDASDLSSSVRSTVEGEDKKRVSSYILNHACWWVGLAAGAVRYMLKNGWVYCGLLFLEENAQLFIDFDIEALLNRMYPHCDSQGKLFINEAFSLIESYNNEGICTKQNRLLSRESYLEYESGERLSDLTKSSEFYSPRF